MSNILAEVIQTRDAVTGDEFRDLLQNVGSKLSQIKTDLVESLQATFVLHDSDIDKVTSWYVEILGIQEKVEDLQQKFQDDRKALKSATEDIESLEEDLEQSDKGIALLQALIQVVRNLEKADPINFYRASELVKSATNEFESILKSFESSEDHAWVVGIRLKITDLVTDIYENASKELRSVFHFHFGKNSLTINLTRDISQLIDTFVHIGYCPRVINKLAMDVWQELLIKACSQDYHIKISSKPRNANAAIKIEAIDDDYGLETVPVRDGDFSTGLSLNCDNAKQIMIKAVRTTTRISQVEVVFSNIQNVLSIFHQIFANNSDVMTYFSEFLGPKICEELGNKTLKILVLRNAEGDVSKAKQNISVVKSFIENFDSQLNFVFPDNTIFDELDRDFDTLFMGQVKQDLLAKIRSLVKGNLHDTQEVVCNSKATTSPGADDIVALHRNPYAFPNCVVSKCVVEIVNVLKDHLKRYKDDILMCDAAFSVYLSLVKIPKHESDAGDLVPLSAVLVHNNSLYLAHHAAFTFPMTEEKVPELRSKSTQAYSFMLRSVRTKLNAMISDAMTGILNNDNESSNAEVDAFLKIASEFVRLHGMFQFVLPPASLDRTLSTLVDHTVNEMCSKVLAWDDISAACANKLATAFTQFAIETSELFKGDASNPREIEALTSKCVTKWNRFRLLAYVLTASMKEIEDKWVGGCGPLSTEFKADELRKLVRALFQNTDRRANFLASIK